MKKVLLLLLVSGMIRSVSYCQAFSLSDTTITFKSQEGKVLSKDEVKEFMKGVFSIRQEVNDGKKIITIIPTGSDQRAINQARIEAFRNSLLNRPIKSFQFTDLNNNKWDSEKLKDQIIVLNFWFTGCKPCILEMPHLNQLVADNKNSVVFIAPAPENEAQINRFLKKYSFDYSIISSSLDYITKMNIENFPTHLVVDKAGIIRQVIIGYDDKIKEKLQVEIDRLLATVNE